MAFNSEQPAHKSLRSIIAERTSKLVFWTGSGLSVEAGLPTWIQLKNSLVKRLREKSRNLDDHGSRRLRAAASRAEKQSNPWIAFQVLKKNLGRASYRDAIREALSPAITADCPAPYLYIWKVGAVGVLNLNLDRLATKALNQFPSRGLGTEFPGRDAGDYGHTLSSPRPFVANLHGTAEDESSWILTKNELQSLLRNTRYKTFINSCLTTTTTIFLGMSAEDMASGGQLAALRCTGFDTGSHYWVTNRNDLATDDWAEEAGIQIIRYGEHSEIIDLFEDILHYLPQDDSSFPPVILAKQHGLDSPSGEQLISLEAEDIRRTLNAQAQSLLAIESPESHRDYEQFSSANDEAIYRAWYTSATPPNNRLLGYTLVEQVARGAFGKVYCAKSADGHQVAIKVLLEDVRQNPDLLRSFRRGVRSMRFLADRNVEGMVAYHEASEIPAFVVMDWVDGPTLAEAQSARQIDDWTSILKIAREMTDVIRRAHAIPERVLHRDIRPSNIMLSGFHQPTEDWKVVVLDFDLSWHQGALEQSVVHGSAIFGYLAPEQIQPISGSSTRHASVDSFGVGMTLFFIIAGKDPIPSQHRHKDWKNVVQDAADSRETSWKSLPYRFTRLILKATEHNQSERWDMAQIKDELERLSGALLSPKKVVSAELLAEEVAARSVDRYDWNDDLICATVRLPSGLEILITGNESTRHVVVNISWTSSGRQERKHVQKWMGAASDQCVKALHHSGWCIRTHNISPHELVVIVAELAVDVAARSLDAQVKVIRDVITILNFE